MGELSRRGWMQAVAATAATAWAGCRHSVGPRPLTALPEGWQRGEERWVTTTCGHCPAGCGVRVRVVEGRAVKIEGQPGHPINGGGIGPKGQAGVQLLYHPDRIPGPLRREGPRGSGRLVPVGWDDAIAQLATALRALRAKGDPQGLVVLDGEPRGLVPRLFDRFLEAYGSPNHLRHASTGDAGKALAMAFMQGQGDVPGYDWANAEYVLGFGVSLFESWCQTIHMSRATEVMRRGRPGRRVKFVHVSPRFSVTAAKADEWVPIEPGTEGALALGLSHVLVRDGLHDAAFVSEHAFGFEDFRDGRGKTHRGFRSLLKDYPPETAARLTGVPVSTIERLAHEMAAHRPAIVLGDGLSSAASNGIGTAMAIHAINGLLGSIERRGGVLAEPLALPSWPALERDPVARAGRAAERVDGEGTARFPLGRGALQSVPDAILSGRPYPVQVAILYRSNPAFSKPEGAKWLEALRKVPLIVSCSPLPDESTFAADLVLPDHTYLERWELVEPAPSSGRPVLGLRQPVVRPRHDTRATADVVIALAHALGGSVADAFPWSGAREVVAEQLGRLAATPAAGVKDGAELLARMQATGAWSGEQSFERWDTAFATPSRRFEFFSQEIAARLSALFPDEAALGRELAARGVKTHGDDLCLPHWEPPQLAGDAAAYPFVLLPHRGIDYAEGGARHLPWLRELPSSGLLAWKETVEISPVDASRLGLEEGDRVRVETPAGACSLYVRCHAGTRPGTLGLSLGRGPWPPDPARAGRQGGNALLAVVSDPLAGLLSQTGTRARVRKEEA